jgi:hypothetical protein
MASRTLTDAERDGAMPWCERCQCYHHSTAEHITKWATNSFGAWNVTDALRLCAEGTAGPPTLLPFDAVWTPKRQAAPLMPEKIAALENELGWRSRPLLFVTVAISAGVPVIAMVDGAHRLSMWAREKPKFIPAYVLPLAASKSVRSASFVDIDSVTDADGITRRLSRAVRVF